MRIQSESIESAEMNAYSRSVQKQMQEYLESLLRHKSDMVNIEAARAICDMKNVSTADLFRPVAGEWLCNHQAPANPVPQFYNSSSPRPNPSSNLLP